MESTDVIMFCHHRMCYWRVLDYRKVGHEILFLYSMIMYSKNTGRWNELEKVTNPTGSDGKGSGRLSGSSDDQLIFQGQMVITRESKGKRTLWAEGLVWPNKCLQLTSFQYVPNIVLSILCVILFLVISPDLKQVLVSYHLHLKVETKAQIHKDTVPDLFH